MVLSDNEKVIIKQLLEISNVDIKFEIFLKKMQDFIDLLLEANKKHNLIGNNTIDNIWSRHIIDSLQLLPYLTKSKNDYCIIDLGSGAGFPAIVLAIASNKHVFLVEKSPVKAIFLCNVCKKLDIKFKIINDKICKDNISNFINETVIITSRAFKSIKEVLSLVDNIYGYIEKIVLLKGASVEKEILDIDRKISKKWEIKKDKSILNEGFVCEIIKSNLS